MLFFLVYSLLSLGLLTQQILCSDMHKIVSYKPSRKVALETRMPKIAASTPKNTISHVSKKGTLCQFGATDILPGAICAVPAIGAGLNLLRYYDKLPHDAFLSEVGAHEADAQVIEYLTTHYAEGKKFPFKKVYVSGAEQGPGVFGNGHLLIPQSWQKEISAYNTAKTIVELTQLCSALEDTDLAKKRLMARKDDLMNVVQNPSVELLIEQEKKNRDLKFKVILPHEEGHVTAKDYRNLNLALLGATIPPVIALACGAPDLLYDFENVSTISEILTKSIMFSGYFHAYKKGILMPFMRYREKKADENIIDKKLGIQYFEELAKKDNTKHDTHPRNSDRAQYLKKLIDQERKNDV